MRFSLATLALICLADSLSLASAGAVDRINDVSYLLARNSQVDGRLRRKAQARVNQVYRRDPQAGSSSTSAAMPTSTPPSVLTNATADAACLSAINAIQPNSTGPSGMAVCYNVPYLDMVSGTFQADLRMYLVAPASGKWASLPKDSISVGLSYPGASVATGQKAGVAKRSSIVAKINERGEIVERSVQMMAGLSFVGEMNNASIGMTIDPATMQAALVPMISLYGMTASGSTLMVNMTSPDPAATYGIFTDQSIAPATSAPATTTAAPPPAVTPVKAAFVIPGRTLGIFPIGLIVTSIWTALFIFTIGLGTFDRYNFRQTYRRRVLYGIQNIPAPFH